MTIAFKGSAEGSQTAAMPSHAVGDLLLIWVFRDGSATLPATVAGWTIVASPIGTSCCAILAYKIAASNAEVPGTWTGGTSFIVAVYGGVDTIGAVASAVGVLNSNYTIPALTLQNSDSWVVCGAGHRSTNIDLEVPPTGTVLRQNRLNATSEAALFDTNGSVASWTSRVRALTGTASGWNTFAVEIKAAQVAAAPENKTMMSTDMIIVATVVTTDSVGNTTESVPVRASEGDDTDSIGRTIGAVDGSIVATNGIPVRVIVGKTTTNSVGTTVEVIPVTGLP